MRSNTKKFLGAVAVAGLVAATGSAFTGTGITNNAPDAQFVGGTVSQTVTGATLSSIAYNASGDGTVVQSVDLGFADALANNEDVSVTVDGGPTPINCTHVPASNTFNCAIGTTVSTLAITVAAAA